MSKMVAFRTSLSGFNKSDVNNYIAETTAEFARIEEEASAKVYAITAELNVAKEEKEAVSAELESAREELESARTELESIRAELEKLSSSAFATKEEFSRIESERDELKAQLEEVTAERDALKAENAVIPTLKDKAERYDAMSGELGEMIISAKKTSCEIIAGAEADAEQMRNETDAQMQGIRADAEKKAGNALEAVSDLLHTMAEDTFGEMMTYASEAQFTVGAMFEELKRKSAEISDRIRYINSSSNRSVKEKLASLPTSVGDSGNLLSDKNASGAEK